MLVFISFRLIDFPCRNTDDLSEDREYLDLFLMFKISYMFANPSTAVKYVRSKPFYDHKVRWDATPLFFVHLPLLKIHFQWITSRKKRNLRFVGSDISFLALCLRGIENAPTPPPYLQQGRRGGGGNEAWSIRWRPNLSAVFKWCRHSSIFEKVSYFFDCRRYDPFPNKSLTKQHSWECEEFHCLE